MWGWLGAIVKGLAGAFFQWWATYEQGRQAQRVKDLEASLRLQQQVDEAARGPEHRIDLEWLYRGSRGDPPAPRLAPTDAPPADPPSKP